MSDRISLASSFPPGVLNHVISLKLGEALLEERTPEAGEVAFKRLYEKLLRLKMEEQSRWTQAGRT